MYGYVYKTINLINNKIYIGQHKSEIFDIEYMGSGKYLRNAINKYGKGNFSVSIIEWANSKKELNVLEKRWIRFYRNLNCDMYNIANGGEGGDVFSGLSSDDKEKRKEKLRKNSYFSTISKEECALMRQHAWETRRKNGNDVFSVEHRQKLSESHKGYVVSEFTKKKLSDFNKGKKLSDEHKKKIGLSNVGKHNMSIENRQKLSKRSKLYIGEKNPFYGKCHSIETKKKIGSYTKERFLNRVWVNNGVVNKRVPINDLLKYKQLGFVEGRIRWADNH